MTRSMSTTDLDAKIAELKRVVAESKEARNAWFAANLLFGMNRIISWATNPRGDRDPFSGKTVDEVAYYYVEALVQLVAEGMFKASGESGEFRGIDHERGTADREYVAALIEPLRRFLDGNEADDGESTYRELEKIHDRFAIEQEKAERARLGR